MFVRIANSEYSDQTASSDTLCRPYWLATSAQNYRTFTRGDR